MLLSSTCCLSPCFGRFGGALGAFKQALVLLPEGTADIYHGIAKALEGMDTFPHDQIKEAIPKFVAATKLQPKNPLFHFDLCGAAFKLRELKQAREVTGDNSEPLWKKVTCTCSVMHKGSLTGPGVCTPSVYSWARS